MFGIDVSKWNGKNDFARAKNDGVEFVIIRSNYGYEDSFQNFGYDECFEENYKSAKSVGLPIGVYCYNYAQTVEQSREEAIRTLKCLKEKSVEIAVFCDAEDEYFLKGDDVTEKIITYLKVIKNAGYSIGIYANLYWYNNYIDLEKIKDEVGDLITWIAHYNRDLYNLNPNHYKGKFHIWQYGSGGYTVDGISNFGGGINYVDVNHSYIDFRDYGKMEKITRRFMIDEKTEIYSLPSGFEDTKIIGNTKDFVGFVITTTRSWNNCLYSQFLGGWIDKNSLVEVASIEIYGKIISGNYSVDTKPWGMKGFKTIIKTEKILGKNFRITAKIGAYYYIHEMAKWVDENAFELKTIGEIAREVIDGKWGNGNERVEKLTESGYDFEKIQEEVNRILGI